MAAAVAPGLRPNAAASLCRTASEGELAWIMGLGLSRIIAARRLVLLKCRSRSNSGERPASSGLRTCSGRGRPPLRHVGTIRCVAQIQRAASKPTEEIGIQVERRPHLHRGTVLRRFALPRQILRETCPGPVTDPPQVIAGRR